MDGEQTLNLKKIIKKIPFISRCLFSLFQYSPHTHTHRYFRCYLPVIKFFNFQAPKPHPPPPPSFSPFTVCVFFPYMMNNLQDWPEPIIRVQSLSEIGLSMIPDRYVKPLSDRPSSNQPENGGNGDANIPIIDLTGLTDDETELSRSTMDQISSACKDWGFFQVVNHGVSPGLMDQARETWRSFFHLPMEIKQAYANSPKTYEGYGSRLGIEKGAILDWSDYYYLHYLPLTLKDYNKWPGSPDYCR